MKAGKIVFAVAAAAGVAFLAILAARRGDADSPPPRSDAKSRPGAVYEPKAEPVRHAPRPSLPVPGGDGRTAGGADSGIVASGEDGGETVEEAGEDGETATVPPELRDDDPALVSMVPERRFSDAVWEALSSSRENPLADGARWLASEDPVERALGGVLLFFGESLTGELLDFVVADEDPLVPLTVCDWVRDFGTEDQADSFRKAFSRRGMEPEELLAFAENSAGIAGGGRSALDLFLAGFGEDEVPVDALVRLVKSPDASYDVREQALFKLLEPETRQAGDSALRDFAAGLSAENGELLPFAAEKLADLALVSNPDGDDEKIWDSESAVVFFLAQTEGGLQARDLANYLEYALRRDDPDYPPVVELGTWEFANDYLLSAKDRSDGLQDAEIDALDRIAASLDRLVEYDPAFNPFETVEDDGDEDEEPEDDDGDEEEDDIEDDTEPDDDDTDGE